MVEERAYCPLQDPDRDPFKPLTAREYAMIDWDLLERQTTEAIAEGERALRAVQEATRYGRMGVDPGMRFA